MTLVILISVVSFIFYLVSTFFIHSIFENIFHSVLTKPLLHISHQIVLWYYQFSQNTLQPITMPTCLLFMWLYFYVVHVTAVLYYTSSYLFSTKFHSHRRVPPSFLLSHFQIMILLSIKFLFHSHLYFISLPKLLCNSFQQLLSSHRWHDRFRHQYFRNNFNNY